ncbi:putative two-component response regulator protein [Hyalangium minutum]|uniref:Putative two-component response regulator protein n=1 Tax=Hyalangium minutum TaxID=394096 RepID=A0A085WKR1_9BACT|nr:putative two-component response regulator protein [Hyalangium minutum]
MRRGVVEIEPVLAGSRRGVDVERVLVLEDDNDLRTLLCELLVASGAAACVSAGSVEAMVRQKEQVLGCELALLDVNLGAQAASGLDAYHWLRENGFGGRIVFLTGHARSHPLVRQAHALTQAQVLSKPIDAKVLMALVGKGDGSRGT